MPDGLEVIVFKLEQEQEAVFDFLADSGTENPDEAMEGFSVTDLRNVAYFEFQTLPDYEPIVRIRVAPHQLWVENREELPVYIHDKLKEEGIPHTVYKPVWMEIDQFSARSPEAVEKERLRVEVEYKG